MHPIHDNGIQCSKKWIFSTGKPVVHLFNNRIVMLVEKIRGPVHESVRMFFGQVKCA